MPVDFRHEINREIGDVKSGLELDNMKLGLEIAQLNEDLPRVAEFEKAIDQILHPDKYRAQNAVDPAAERERMLRFDQE